MNCELGMMSYILLLWKDASLLSCGKGKAVNLFSLAWRVVLMLRIQCNKEGNHKSQKS